MKKEKYLEKASYTWTEDSVRLILTPSQLAKSIYFYVQEAGDFKTDGRYFTERQNLNSFLIIYTLEGEGSLSYLGQEWKLTSGSCFLINCMQHHCYRTAPAKTWSFLWLHFNSSNALGYYEESAKNGFKVLQMEESTQVESSIRTILQINQKRVATTEAITSSLINTILTEILVRTATQSSVDILIPKYLKKAIKYMDLNFQKEIPLEEIAELCSISKFHLSKEFKKYIGVTIHEYLIQSRLSYAKELLKYSEYAVGEIVYSCGMNNVSHFINLFRDREGMTPNQYRKEWKGSHFGKNALQIETEGIQ